MKLLRMPGASGTPVYVRSDGVVMIYVSNVGGQEDLTKSLVSIAKDGVNYIIQVGAHVDRVAAAVMAEQDIPIAETPPPAPQLRAIPTAIRE